MAPQRAIDRAPDGKRTRPMQVLILGFSRTGTMSMYTALQKLDLKPYHMIEAIQTPHHFPMWEDGLRAKYCGQGKPFGRREFDKLLGDFDSVLDFPNTILHDELIAAYPEAKVVLTNRDPDKWLRSTETSIGVIMEWNWDLVAPLGGPLVRKWWSIVNLFLRIWPSPPTPPGRAHWRQGYLDHYEYIRSIVPKERLLEHTPADGYEPLCKFLGRPVPKEAYPHVNDSAGFVDIHRGMWWYAFVRSALTVAAPVVAGVAGWAWYNGWQPSFSIPLLK